MAIKTDIKESSNETETTDSSTTKQSTIEYLSNWEELPVSSATTFIGFGTLKKFNVGISTK